MAAEFPEAYGFKSPLSLDQMLEALNAAGPWTWTARDSDTYGDYLISRPDDGPTRLRVVQSREGFLLDIYVSQRPEKRLLSRAEIEAVVTEQLLPALEAVAVTPAQGL